MSCFIWFYVFAPLIFRYVKNLNSARNFLWISFIISIAWKAIIRLAFSGVPNLDSISTLAGSSPFGVMYQFATGVLVYYFLKENKLFESACELAMLALVGLILKKDVFVWCVVVGLFIIAANGIVIPLGEKFTKIVKKVGRESFHVYLAHLLSFEMSWYLVSFKLGINGFGMYVLWGIISICSILVICMVMNLVEKAIAKFSSQ